LVARPNQNDNRHPGHPQVLLVLDPLVNCQQNLVPGHGHQGEQLAIFFP
jgi:hypothetical protein